MHHPAQSTPQATLSLRAYELSDIIYSPKHLCIKTVRTWRHEKLTVIELVKGAPVLPQNDLYMCTGGENKKSTGKVHPSSPPPPTILSQEARGTCWPDVLNLCLLPPLIAYPLHCVCEFVSNSRQSVLTQILIRFP